MPYFVYVLYSSGHDRYYIGQTQDLSDRLDRHNSGTEQATSPYIPWIVLWHTEKPSRSEALILERKLKNLSRQRLKEFLVKHKKE